MSIRAFAADFTVYMSVLFLVGGGIAKVTLLLWVVRYIEVYTQKHTHTQSWSTLRLQITIYKTAFHLHLKSSLSHTLLLTPFYPHAHPL